MPPTEYEFRLVTKRQKYELIAFKVGVIVLLSVCLALLVVDPSPDVGTRMRLASFAFTALFIYTNLLQVKVDVRDLFISTKSKDLSDPVEAIKEIKQK